MRWLSVFSACVLGASIQALASDAAVTVRLTTDGARVTYSLDRRVSSFEFNKASVDRKAEIEILTPAITWTDDGAAVQSARPFKTFELLLRPASRDRDAQYPVLVRVGKGALIYGPALAGSSGWQTRLRVVPSKGDRVMPTGRLSSARAFFTGPATYVFHTQHADYIAPPEMPSRLRDRVEGILGTSLMTYAKQLRVDLDARPIVVLAYDGNGNGFTGDVSPGPLVSLRFHSPVQEQLTDAATSRLTRFVAHEAFHFWNGHLANSEESARAAWLHEGGADYASLLVSTEMGQLDDEGMQRELSTALTNCRRALERQGDVGMDALQFLSRNVRYPCGMIIHWAADLEAKRAGRGGFYDVWAKMIASAGRRKSRTYTVGDFYEAVGREGGEPFPVARRLTAEQGPARWSAVESDLESLGAAIQSGPTPETRREGVILHLLAQVCTSGQRGFYTEPGGIRLQANATCTLIADNSVLTSVEGDDPAALAEATYATVQARCAARESVRVVLDSTRDVAIPCHQDLEPARVAYSVSRWR